MTAGDLSGLRADLLRARQGATAEDQDAAPSTAVWIEDPVSAPAGSAIHTAGEDVTLHPDDLVALHELPGHATTDPAPAAGPGGRAGPGSVPRTDDGSTDGLWGHDGWPDAWLDDEAHDPGGPADAHPRRRLRGSADGLSLWDDPEDDAPDEPLRRGRGGGLGGGVRGDRAARGRWVVVAAAVLAFLVGAGLSALVTEVQVRSERAATAAALSSAEDARQALTQARTALQEARRRAGSTAPVPQAAEPSSQDDAEGTGADGTDGTDGSQDGAGGSTSAPSDPTTGASDPAASSSAAASQSAPAPSAAPASPSGSAPVRDRSADATGAADDPAGADGAGTTDGAAARSASADAQEESTADGGCVGAVPPEGDDAGGGDGPTACP